MASCSLLIASLKGLHQPLGGLIIDPNDAILAGCDELAPVMEVVKAKNLIPTLSDRVQTLSTFDVPVQNLTIKLTIDRYQHTFRLRLRSVWTPAQLSCWERGAQPFFALSRVQHKLLLASIGIIDVDCTICKRRCQVLLVGREADTKAV